MSLLTLATLLCLADPDAPAATPPDTPAVTEMKSETPPTAGVGDDDNDSDDDDDDEVVTTSHGEDGKHHKRVHRHMRHKREHDHHWQKAREWDDVVRGFGVTAMGGGDFRAREDMARLGRQLGPAGDPSRFGGMLALEAYLQLTKYARIGLDFTMTGMSSVGRGFDRGNIEVRQAVDYKYWAGGLLAEAVVPLSAKVELSIGTVLGGGRFGVEGRSTRLSDYSQLGTDLRAIPKSESFSLEAPAFFAKPAIGVKVKFSKHVALDIKAGVNVFYVFKNTLAVFNDFALNGSPDQTEVMPFAAIGVSFGSWAQ